MSWLPFRSTKSTIKRVNSFDHKLVKKAGGRSVPRFSQIKYLFHFLSRPEKIFFNISFAVAILGTVALGAVYFTSHIIRIPKEGGEYTEALIGQPKYINPIYASASDVDQDLASLVYAGLFRFDKNQKLVPEIAESYEVSSSSKSYDIKLREDVKFADGQPLTATDVLYTFELIQNPEVESPLKSTFQGVEITRVDNYTVRFTLKEPFAPFLSSLTVGILPEHIWGNVSANSIRLAKNNLQPIGAGPWQFSKMVKDASGKIDSYTLSRNEFYFKNKPYFKTLRFKFFDEYTGAIEALRSQSVDGLSFLPRGANLKFNNKNISYYSIQLPQYTALFFNQAFEPMLKNDDVRVALSKAVDKERLIVAALEGSGERADSPIIAGNLGYDKDLKKIAFNLEEANTLLDKKWTKIQPEEYFKLRQADLMKEFQPASSTEMASSTPTSTPEREEFELSVTEKIRQEMDPEQTFYRKDKDNKILELTITTISTEEYGKAAEQIAKMWSKVGVKTNVQKISANRLVRELIKNRNYQILLYGEVIGGDPDPYPFWHSSQVDYPGLNLALYSNRTADQILEDARSTVEDVKRAELYGKFQNILTEEIPAIFLYTPLHTMAINKSIKGVDIKYISSPADRYNDISNWYVKTKLRWK